MKKLVFILFIIISSFANTAFGATATADPATPFNATYSIATAKEGLAPSAITFDMSKEVVVDARLQTSAEIRGFGYKTANLMELQELVHDRELQATLKTHSCSLDVPAFHGIASPNIVTYLETNGINPTFEWAKIVETVTPAMSAEAFATKQLPATFAGNIVALGRDLKNFFDKQAAAVESRGLLRSCLHHVFGSTSFVDNLTPFLEAASKEGQMLIVRSTGMEDKKGLANAGGNESIKFVAPTVPAILRAMGQVIESYFSVKSFSQRLVTGDKTIFQLPAIPILVQVMVAAPAHRPIECVIHTTDQAGPTPGLVSLNCGYEVVASSQRADQCYHFHTGAGHCILAKGVEHVPISVRLALTAVATHIEHYYQRATDVELLITTKANGSSTIHVVQARPLNRPATLASSSYIANVATVAPENIVSAQTIVTAGSSVRHVTAQNQLIVAPTLAAALTYYLTAGIDKATVLAVAVQGEAEPNSHEATTFATEGKLVMVARDYEKVTTWHAAPSLNLYLDPQNGFIINPDSTIPTIADGYTTHPMPAHVSIEALATATTLPFTIEDHLPTATATELITNLKQGSVEDVHSALAALLARINHHVATAQDDVVCSAAPAICIDAQEKLATLENFARQKAGDALPLLTLERNDLRRLAAIKPLEVLLTQEEDPALVDTYSVASVVKEFTERKTFVEQHGHTLTPALLSDLRFLDIAQTGHTVAMTSELETKWLTFVSNATTTPTTQQQLLDIWQTLEQFKLTSLWINTLFNAAAGDTAAMLTLLHQDVLAARKVLTQVGTLHHEIGKLTPTAWSDPDKFDSNFATLRGLVARFTCPEFITYLTGANKLVIAATLSTMDSFVDTFDRSIKALKASSIDHKVEHFKEMLGVYHTLLQTWAPQAQTHISFHPDWPLDTYVAQIKTILDELNNDDAQLLPSRDFSVSAATMSSTTAFERHFPKTLEDVFTLVHQNLLIVTGALTNHELSPLLAKPTIFTNLETILFQHTGMHHISLSCVGTTMHARYNLPLQNHSSVFDIIYAKTTNTAQLIMRFVGERRNRWDNIEAHALMDKTSRSMLMTTLLTEQEVTLTYTVQQALDTTSLIQNLETYINFANQVATLFTPTPQDVVDLADSLVEKAIRNEQIRPILIRYVPLRVKPYTAMLTSSDRCLFYCALLSQNSATPTDLSAATIMATTEIANNDSAVQQNEALQLFIELIKHNHIPALDAATAAATAGTVSSEYGAQYTALQLFIELVKHNHILVFAAATAAATAGVEGAIHYIHQAALHQAALHLFIELVKSNYTLAFAAATNAASQDITSTELWMRNEAQKLQDVINTHLPHSYTLLAGNAIGGMAKPTTIPQIKYLASQGVTLVVTLTEDPLSPTLFEGTTIKNIHLPIASGAAPTPEQVATFLHETEQAITSGGKVVVHCEQGLNRTGTMLALWLMAHENMTAEEAITLVREQRPGSIGSSAQEEFLRTWKR